VVTGPDRWELLERIGAYTASELSAGEAREVEQLIREDPEVSRVAESYLSMLALLGAIGDETPEAPEAVINYAIRRAYISTFLRQAEELFAGTAQVYLDAFVYYFGLKRPGPVG
jgi:anti-sigma-K factor RskA